MTYVFGLNGGNKRICPFQFLARRDGGRPDGTYPRMEGDSIRELSHGNFRVLNVVEATLLLLDLDFGFVRRRRVAAVRRCRLRKRRRIYMRVRIVKIIIVPIMQCVSLYT